MSESKHTPGPIEVSAVGDFSDYEGRCIVLIGDDRRIAIVLGTDEEAKANAALYAAAPELLDACKIVTAFLDSLEHAAEHSDPLVKIRRKVHAPLRAALNSAIAKAEGRS